MAQAFRGPDGNFGFGLGTLIMLVNVILLWGYTLSLPFVPAHHRRPAEELLHPPGPVLDLDPGLQG